MGYKSIFKSKMCAWNSRKLIFAPKFRFLFNSLSGVDFSSDRSCHYSSSKIELKCNLFSWFQQQSFKRVVVQNILCIVCWAPYYCNDRYHTTIFWGICLCNRNSVLAGGHTRLAHHWVVCHLHRVYRSLFFSVFADSYIYTNKLY